ncbi:porin family protein [Marinoscillum furvescens]|nr:hypothetical protein [Marinoscillum furvescens]
MIRYTYIVLFLLLVSQAMAQETDTAPTGAIEDAQIIIEKDKPLTLPRASRVYKPSAIQPVVTDTVNLSFYLSQPQATFDPYAFSPEVKSLSKTEALEANTNYLKVGFGNYLSPEIRGFAGVADGNRRVGLFVDHESFARGPVRKDESAYSNTQVILQGSLSNTGLVVSPFVNYELERYYFYGYEDEPAEQGITDRIATNYFRLGSDFSGSNGAFSYTATPFLAFTTMGASGQEAFNRESNLGLNGSGTYKQNESLEFRLGTDYSYSGYQSGVIQKRHVFHLIPEVRYHNDRLLLAGGAALGVSSDSVGASTALGVFPRFKGSFAINEQFAIMANATGGFAANDLNTLRKRNRYLEDTLTLLNQREHVNMEIALEYKMRHDMSLEPFISYSNTANYAFFVPSGLDSARYTLRYDTGGLGRSAFGVRYRLINNRSQLSAEMAMVSYQTDTLAEAWYLPGTTLKLNYSQLIGEQWRVHGEMYVWDGLKGPVGGTSEAYVLPTIVDLSVGGSYQIDDRFSAYVDIENLLGIRYERYLNYPVRGITAKIGFIYRF